MHLRMASDVSQNNHDSLARTSFPMINQDSTMAADRRSCQAIPCRTQEKLCMHEWLTAEVRCGLAAERHSVSLDS